MVGFPVCSKTFSIPAVAIPQRVLHRDNQGASVPKIINKIGTFLIKNGSGTIQTCVIMTGCCIWVKTEQCSTAFCGKAIIGGCNFMGVGTITCVGAFISCVCWICNGWWWCIDGIWFIAWLFTFSHVEVLGTSCFPPLTSFIVDYHQTPNLFWIAKDKIEKFEYFQILHIL